MHSLRREAVAVHHERTCEEPEAKALAAHQSQQRCQTLSWCRSSSSMSASVSANTRIGPPSSNTLSSPSCSPPDRAMAGEPPQELGWLE